MLWISNEEHALDCSEGRSSEPWKGIDSRSGSLGVTFQDEAFVGAGLQGGLDLVDDLFGQGQLVCDDGSEREFEVM